MEGLPDNSSAAGLLFENLWAVRLKEKIMRRAVDSVSRVSVTFKQD